MQIKPSDLSFQEMHKLMIGCVVPRPIAWVATQDNQGICNLAPFSYFNAVGASPPALSIAVTTPAESKPDRKDTLSNILALREFAVNVVDEASAEAMVKTATEFPAEIDEFERVGVTRTPSTTIRPPRVAEAPISFECLLYTNVPVGYGPGSATLVIGLITSVYVRDDLINDQYHIDIRALKPVGRLAGKSYCTVQDIFDIAREPYKPGT